VSLNMDRWATGIVIGICFVAVWWWLVVVLSRKRHDREQRRSAREREAQEAKTQLQARVQATLRVDRGEESIRSEPDTECNTCDRPRLELARTLKAGSTGPHTTSARQKHAVSVEQALRYSIRAHPYLAMVLLLAIGLAVSRRATHS
jgi:cbb3-type cytochrome oxidase subunit 3